MLETSIKLDNLNSISSFQTMHKRDSDFYILSDVVGAKVSDRLHKAKLVKYVKERNTDAAQTTHNYLDINESIIFIT